MKTCAFIFARGGSKGLPGKNIKPLLGKPLLHYSIDIANSILDGVPVFVSTDCNEIAASALSVGAVVIKRPPELATDNSPEWLSWQHAVNYVYKHYSRFDTFVSLPCTSPLRSVDDVMRAINHLKESSADACISTTPANRNPYFNMVEVGEDQSLNVILNKHNIARRQDAPHVFDITTVVYACTTQHVLQSERLFDGRVVGIEVPKERAVDIDDIYDFYLAEAILRGIDE